MVMLLGDIYKEMIDIDLLDIFWKIAKSRK